MRGTTRHRYEAFAVESVDSPCFSSWAAEAAADEAVMTWVGALPEHKQQPNLVFAAARWHGAEAPGPYEGLRAVLLERSDAVRATILSRATQTNEVGRLATVVPVLAALDEARGPLSLVEVGASAGLCLYPDRYDYDWPGSGSLTGSHGPTLRASTAGPVPMPSRHPRVVWRGGCDLNPLEVDDDESMQWLETLVWPEHEDRRLRLREAIEVARAEPPHLVAGDLFEELPGLLEEAGRHGRPVVLHSAVIAYLDDAQRERFHDQMSARVDAGTCHWVSNEAPQVLPRLTATIPDDAREVGGFVLAVDGRAVARTHPHGRRVDWVAPA